MSKKKKKTPKPTEIVVVLDRSGSMASIKDDAIGGFNTFAKQQAEAGGECLITALQFDERFDVMFEGEPAASAEIDDKVYVPRGSTALRDAIARGVALLRQRLAKAKKGALAVLVILTDGYENSSREVSPDGLKSLLEKCDDDGWGVIYLAADQDAIAVGSGLGVKASKAVDFSRGNLRAAYGAAGQNVASFRSSGKAEDLSWSEDQRRKLAN